MADIAPGGADGAVVTRHYERLADSYDTLLRYSPEFVRTLTRRMIEELELTPDDRLVDLGCGTGMYSLDILEQVPLEHPVIGVDPFESMLEHIPVDAPIRPVAMGGLAFSRREATYDKILIKEAVHHISPVGELFENLHERLRPGGILLLVHVPPDVDYPLFDAALERCLEWHADPDELERLLRGTGFTVARDRLTYHHTLPVDEYHAMVADRYMSVLSSFDEDELQAGLREMEARHADLDVLEFPDRFDYLTARRPAAD